MATSLPAGATCRAGTAQGVLLACATVLVVITISPLFPILPRIAATYAANPAYASLATSAVVLPSLLIGLFSVPAGLLGERVGRRRVLIGGAVLFSAAAPLPALLHGFGVLLACRALTGVALAAMLTAAAGLTGDYFPPAERQRWLALQSGLPSVAAILCGAIGGLLGDIDWRLVFTLNAVGIAFAVAAVLLTSDRFQRTEPQEAVEATAPVPWRFVLGIGGLLAWASAVVFPIAYEMGFLFAERGVAGSSAAGLGSAALAAGAMLGAMLAGFLPAGAGRAKLFLGFATSGAGLLLFVSSRSTGVALAACGLSGLSQGMIIPVLATWLLNGTPLAWRGWAVGLLQAMLYVAQFASPLLARALSQTLGAAAGMRLYAIAGLLTAAVLLLTGRWGGVGRGGAGRQPAKTPPSITSSAPVTKRAASEQR